MTLPLNVTPVIGAGGGGPLPERGGGVLARGAGRLGATPVGPHPENQHNHVRSPGL